MKRTSIANCILFTAFIATQAFAYEKSGFFVGVQGGFVSQEKTITNSYYNFDLEQKATGSATVSGAYINKQVDKSITIDLGIFKPTIGISGTIGEIFGVGNSANSNLKTVGNSAINIAVNTFFSKDVDVITDTPYNVGVVFGYKKIFSSGLNAKQFVGNNLTKHASGLRYYVSIDASGSGKKSGYATVSANANLDFLYNLFPNHNYFDVGAFAGVSVGWVKHRTPIYSVQGVDYGLNFGLRWTIKERHTIELYGRYGLSKVERRTQNTHSESYVVSDLSSVAMDNTSVEIDNGASMSSGSTLTASGQLYIGNVEGSNTSGKTPVTPYYGTDGNVYYKRFNAGATPSGFSGETLYEEEANSGGLYTFKVYEENKTAGSTPPTTYAQAYAKDNTGTYYYYWTTTYNTDGTTTKSVQLKSTQSTTGGGTIENIRTTTQVYKSYPIDSIEEIRNPFRFGIRYTYTF